MQARPGARPAPSQPTIQHKEWRCQTAERTRARAIRRCGELLRAIKAAEGSGAPNVRGGVAPEVSRSRAARDAGNLTARSAGTTPSRWLRPDQHHGARADDAPSQQPLGSGQWLSSRTRFHRSSGSVHPGSRGATDVGARFVLRDEALVVAGYTTSQGLPAVRRPEPDSLDGTSRSERALSPPRPSSCSARHPGSRLRKVSITNGGGTPLQWCRRFYGYSVLERPRIR